MTTLLEIESEIAKKDSAFADQRPTNIQRLSTTIYNRLKKKFPGDTDLHMEFDSDKINSVCAGLPHETENIEKAIDKLVSRKKLIKTEFNSGVKYRLK